VGGVNAKNGKHFNSKRNWNLTGRKTLGSGKEHGLSRGWIGKGYKKKRSKEKFSGCKRGRNWKLTGLGGGKRSGNFWEKKKTPGEKTEGLIKGRRFPEEWGKVWGIGFWGGHFTGVQRTVACEGQH